jgi:hypothetical protein
VPLGHESTLWAAPGILLLNKPLILGHAQDEAEAHIIRLKALPDSTSHDSPSSHEFSTPANQNAQDAPSRIVNMSCGIDKRTVSDSSNGGNSLGLSYHEQELQPLGSQEPYFPAVHQETLGRENELPLCSMDEYMNIDSFDAGIYPQDGFVPQRKVDDNTGAAILEPVKKFSSAIVRNQAETLVMASVVADYIAWLRKAPPGGGIPNVSESPVYLGMLDNLEIRLRELCEMSQSKSTGALQELVADLGAIAPPGGAMAARLGSFEKELQKEARERAEFFRSRYNPCALLSEQARKTSE